MNFKWKLRQLLDIIPGHRPVEVKIPMYGLEASMKYCCATILHRDECEPLLNREVVAFDITEAGLAVISVGEVAE